MTWLQPCFEPWFDCFFFLIKITNCSSDDLLKIHFRKTKASFQPFIKESNKLLLLLLLLLHRKEGITIDNTLQVDDKYQYSMDNKDGGVHGWISSDPIVGFWIIFPTNEFRNGGPTKQNLTVHTGPAALAVCSLSLALSLSLYIYISRTHTHNTFIFFSYVLLNDLTFIYIFLLSSSSPWLFLFKELLIIAIWGCLPNVPSSLIWILVR